MAGENHNVTPEDVKTAINELRGTVEKYGADSVDFKEKTDRVEKTLEDNEKKHKSIIAELELDKKKSLDLEERFKNLELELVKVESAKCNYKETPEYKAVDLFMRKGIVDDTKTLRMDSLTSGGALTTVEMDNVLLKEITEISPVRQVARVRTTSKKTLEIAKRTSIPVATYEGETGTASESESSYANEQITSYRLTNVIPFTVDLMNDSEFNLENEINQDNSQAFSFKEGNKFVLGNSSKQPEGFATNANIIANAMESETVGTITGDDLLLLTGELKVGQNPMFSFTRQTLAFLRTLKGEDKHYLWQAGLAANVPNTIAGEPYIVMQDMPQIVSGSLAVMYADFRRGYLITDRTGTTIIRDDITLAAKAIIKLTFHRWNTGQVVLDEAFKALRIKS